MIPAAICTVIAAVDLADVLNKPIISPGWGLYMSVIASLVTTALALVQLARGPGR
jgi:hypothetical protein